MFSEMIGSFIYYAVGIGIVITLLIGVTIGWLIS